MLVRRAREIFLSHSSADRAEVEKLCDRIEALGFSCWRAPRDVAEGSDYAESIHNAIRDSRLFLLLLSPAAAGSRHVRREVEIAERNHLDIVPIRLCDTTSFGALDYFVNTSQWIDSFGEDNHAIELLSTLLEDRLGAAKAILSIDGGGPLALFSLGTLKGIERTLKRICRTSGEFRLSDYFDLVAGSGSGAFISAALQVGRTVEEIEDFFLSIAPRLFGRTIKMDQCYSFSIRDRADQRIAKQVAEFIGSETTLGSIGQSPILALIIRNMTMLYPWPVTNNVKARYNQPGKNGTSNLELPLADLAYASLLWNPSASHTIRVGEGVYSVGDGTFTPYCNPAFQAFQLATLPGYRLEWAATERRMLLVSVGSGQSVRSEEQHGPGQLAAQLSPFLSDSVSDQDLKCRLFGRCIFGGAIDREVGNLLRPLTDRDSRSAFTYVRYDPIQQLRSRHDLDLTQSRALDISSARGRAEAKAMSLRASDIVTEEHLEPWTIAASKKLPQHASMRASDA